MREFSFLLTGQLPGGKGMQQISRDGHRYPNPRFEEWRKESTRQLVAQGVRELARFDRTCKVEVRYFKGDHKRRDVPGMMDALCHLLEWTEVIIDDSQFTDWNWRDMGLDREDPRVFITIKEMRYGRKYKPPKRRRRRKMLNPDTAI